ncbi:MAG: hypothetical protein H8E66_24365 [Planctomycetes bacterium]|nr:hypothetical protein [Planctomycetota bacterium]
MESGVSQPACKALLLCEKTIIEAGSGDISLINIIDHIPVLEFPGHTQPVEAFLQFTDAEGRYEVVVEVRDCEDDEVLARAVGAGIEIPERHATCNILIPVPSLKIQHSGLYDFVVLANGIEIQRQQFAVVAIDDEECEDE